MPVPTGTSITDFANGVAGLVVVMSGMVAGMARSVAVLHGASAKYVDRMTAAGFLVGAAVAILCLVGDLLGG